MSGRWYPFAGSCQYADLGSNGLVYKEQVGWISWLSNKGRSCAHVAFADGHTEKILEPRDGGLDAKELTALLCEGKDVSFDGSGYQEVRETD